MKESRFLALLMVCRDVRRDEFDIEDDDDQDDTDTDDDDDDDDVMHWWWSNVV